MRVTRLFAAMALGLVSPISLADDPDQAIRQTLSNLNLGLPIESIGESPLEGIYQVQLKGGRMLYTSADGQYLMQGYLYHVQNGKPVNLTEQSESRSIAKEINAIPANEMVVFAPTDKPAKAHITVFTDTDCGYCQKLHSEVPELNRRGIEVRYVAFPRQGIGSLGYNTLVSVWCSKDRQAAMNQAKSRLEVPQATCENPVAKQFGLGRMIGVNGTPAIVLGNGQLIPGYQPAPQLAQLALEAK